QAAGRNPPLLAARRTEHAAADDVSGGCAQRQPGARGITVADPLDYLDDPNRAVVGSGRPPVIAPGHTFGTVTDKISSIVLSRKTPLGWWLGFLLAFFIANVLLVSIAY